ncbi:uncharacterized protein LOC115713626 [Cannabis sativa]|uniref:uncharacterized protein LOC115713626 n=1 Tax=Cannabis sativa TaxID=3483 RepID=UPI0029C9C5AC|nr:uncharacterized protein LOC115713626 [Cannabis sativa]
MGDMNNVCAHEDKMGGNRYPDFLINGFQQALNDSGLQDTELYGYPFTWERGRGTSSWIEVCLDRGLADLAWLQIFSSTKLYNLEISTSDHSPILLELFTTAVQQRVTRFRLENAWLRELLCYQLIKDFWDGCGDVEVQQKIQRCGQRLVVWGKEFTGNFKERIQQCKNEVQK